MRDFMSDPSSTGSEAEASDVPAQRSERAERAGEADRDEEVVSEDDPTILLGYN